MGADLIDDQAGEFLPLPYYAWEQRPDTVPLDYDECATALHISDGDMVIAARLLKAPLYRLQRFLKHSPRLQLVQEESLEQVRRRAEHEVISGLDAADDRRREWAASKILGSRLGQSSALAPAPAASTSTSVSISAREVVYTWREAAPDNVIIDGGASAAAD
jgi:hypothetical protein